MRKIVLFQLLFFFMITFGFGEEIYNSFYPIKQRLETYYVKYKVGFIDYEGNLVIPFEYSWGTIAENGIAAAEKNDKQYLINKKNEILYECKCILFDGFSDGLCKAKEDNKYGYINQNGEVVIPFIYDSAEEFQKGYAKVYQGKECFYIDKKGNRAKVDPEYFHTDGEYTVFIDSVTKKYGLKKMSGEILIPAKYTYLSLPNRYGYCIFSTKVDDPVYGLMTLDNQVIYSDDTFFELWPFKEGMAIFNQRNREGGYLRDDGKIFWFKDYY